MMTPNNNRSSRKPVHRGRRPGLAADTAAAALAINQTALLLAMDSSDSDSDEFD